MTRNTDRLSTKTTRRQNNTLIHCPGEKSNRSSRCGAETRSVGAPQPDDQDNTPHLGCTDSKEKNQDNKPEFALIGLQPASSSSSDALQLVALAQQQRCFSARCWPATPWSMAQQKHFPPLTLLPTPADEASHLLPNSRGRQNGVQRSV